MKDYSALKSLKELLTININRITIRYRYLFALFIPGT